MSEEIVFKPSGIPETFEIDWRLFIVQKWRPDTDYSVNQIVVPPVGNGHLYVATTAGTSSMLLPRFTPGVDELVDDGTIVWTAKHPSTESLVAISQSDWTLDAGVVQDSKAITGFITSVTASGGENGKQYRLTNRITKSDGEPEELSLILQITDPPSL